MTSPTPDPHLVITERVGRHIASVSLNRPGSRNALDRGLLAALSEALSLLKNDDSVRALILSGTGQAFCAGADLRERLRLTPAERGAHTDAVNAVADILASFPAPVVAAIRGAALGGGAELALACDMRVAAEDAVIGFPEVSIGIFPGAGAPVRLPRLIGPGPARELLFTGRRIDGKEAWRLGLVNHALPGDRVLDRALEICREIAANTPGAMRALKQALVESDGALPADAHRIVRRHRAPLDSSAEYEQGLAAFNKLKGEG